MSVAGIKLYCWAMLSKVSPGATLWRIKRDSAGFWHCLEEIDLLVVAGSTELAGADIGSTNRIKGSSSQRGVIRSKPGTEEGVRNSLEMFCKSEILS